MSLTTPTKRLSSLKGNELGSARHLGSCSEAPRLGTQSVSFHRKVLSKNHCCPYCAGEETGAGTVLGTISAHILGNV